MAVKTRRVISRKKIIIASIISVIFLCVLVVAFTAFRLFLSTGGFQAERINASRKIVFADQPSTILLLGVDGLDKKDVKNSYEKAERSGAQRSDSMILIDFNPQTGVAEMTSLMRDMKMPIACDNNIEDKLGHSFAAAQDPKNSASKNIELGAECAAKSIENKLGVPVDNYVYVNFSGFLKIINQLGGIDIDVIGNAPKGTKFCEQDEHGNGGNPDENTWNVGKYCFVVGSKRHLNAEQALAYSRHRHMDNDSWRNRRQQQVMKAVVKEMIKPSRLFSLPSMLNSLQESIKSTIKISDILDFTKKHSDYLSDLDNSLIIKNNVFKYIDDMENGVYYAKFDQDDLEQKIKLIRQNLELDKNKESIPSRIENFDFDYYRYKQGE